MWKRERERSSEAGSKLRQGRVILNPWLLIFFQRRTERERDEGETEPYRYFGQS